MLSLINCLNLSAANFFIFLLPTSLIFCCELLYFSAVNFFIFLLSTSLFFCCQLLYFSAANFFIFLLSTSLFFCCQLDNEVNSSILNIEPFQIGQNGVQVIEVKPKICWLGSSSTLLRKVK